MKYRIRYALLDALLDAIAFLCIGLIGFGLPALFLIAIGGGQ